MSKSLRLQSQWAGGVTVSHFNINKPLCVSEIGSEHGKSLFLLLSKMKLVPSLEAQKDMVKWVLQVSF